MTALTVLRGKNNLEIVNIELKNIIENMEQVKQNVKTSDQGSMLKYYYGILTDPTFFKPFGVLLLLFPYALNWTGIDAVQFYFVPILRLVLVVCNEIIYLLLTIFFVSSECCWLSRETFY